MKKLYGYKIKFEDVNKHSLTDFKERFATMIKDEAKNKKLNIGKLGDQLSKLGYHYPILKALFNAEVFPLVPIDYYLTAMVLVGIDLYIFPNGEESYLDRNIKRRVKNGEDNRQRTGEN